MHRDHYRNPSQVSCLDFAGKVLLRNHTQLGKPYNSLTAIANEISGSRWSGPAFFGLRDAQKNGKEVRA